MPTLSWLTREEDTRAASRVPYRLLEEASDLSAGDPVASNILIQDDNLEALKSRSTGCGRSLCGWPHRWRYLATARRQYPKGRAGAVGRARDPTGPRTGLMGTRRTSLTA